MTINVLFLGNCQLAKYRVFHRDLGYTAQESRFASITPFFGNYDEEGTMKLVEDSDLVVSQLVTSDVTFSRKNILNMRPNKETIFVPYCYLTGFRRMEKISSKGTARVDGEKYFLEALKNSSKTKATLGLLSGEIQTENKLRLSGSLNEIKNREGLGCDVFVSDYVRDTYRERLPSYSINHPTPHVLCHVYNQIASLAGFKKADLSLMSDMYFARKVLPEGTGGLSPYCVEELDLQYAAPDHWYGRLNQICSFLYNRHTRETANLTKL